MKPFFSWAASLGHCSSRKPILLISSRTGGCLTETEMKRNICHIYCWSLTVWTKSPHRPQARILGVTREHCFSLQPHISDWLISSQIPLRFVLFTISTALKFRAQFFFPELAWQSSHWSLPWSHLLPNNVLDASRCANISSLLKLLKQLHWLQKDTQTSWEAFKEFHKLAPTSQCHLSQTRPIFQPCRTTWGFS